MRCLSVILLLSILLPPLYGQVQLRKDEVVEIISEVEYLVDSTGRLELEEVQSGRIFYQAPPEGLRFTDLEGNLWLRINLGNPFKKEENGILRFDDPSLFEITLYESGEPASRSGTSADQDERDVPGNHNAFLITFAPESSESVYIRIHSENLITATASLYDDDLYHEKARKEYIFLGVFYGIMLLVTLLSVVLWLLTRMPLFLIYGSYILVSMLFTGMLDGFTPMYLNPLVEFSRGYLEYILAGVSNALALFFTISFLKTANWSKRVHNVLRRSAWVLLGLTFLILMIAPGEGFELMRLIGLIVLVLILWVASLAVKQRVAQSVFFLWAFMALGVFVLIFIFNLFRLVPFGFVTQYALHFGILLNMLILSMGLAVRVYHKYRTSFEEVLSKQELYSLKNTELEQLVWERTKAVIYKENELRSIIDNSDNLIWMVDTDYVVREMNKGFAESWISAFEKKLKKGRNILEQLEDAEERKLWQGRYDRIFKGEKLNFTERYVINNEVRFFEINAYPIRDGNNITAAALFSTEITERMHYEKQLKDKNAALQKANEELDSFVYSASHDLKAPLASIQGLIGLSRDETNKDQLSNYYDMMERSIRRLDQFIRDIIDYSRNTRMDNEQEEIDLENLVSGILEDLRYMDPTQDTEIKVVPEQKRPLISDSTRLRIILRNLISNAIRYGKPDDRKAHVEVKWKVKKKNAVIKVGDNGPGIDSKHIPHIFDMFYRANETASGSGLGLYIVKESVKKLGGSIDVSSSPGQGTTFTVKIPNNLS